MNRSFDNNVIHITGMPGAPVQGQGHIYYRVVEDGQARYIPEMSCFYSLQTALNLTDHDVEPVLLNIPETALLWLDNSEGIFKSNGNQIVDTASSVLLLAQNKGYRGLLFMDDYHQPGIMVFDPSDVKSPYNSLSWNDQKSPGKNSGPLIPVLS